MWHERARSQPSVLRARGSVAGHCPQGAGRLSPCCPGEAERPRPWRPCPPMALPPPGGGPTAGSDLCPRPRLAAGAHGVTWSGHRRGHQCHRSRAGSSRGAGRRDGRTDGQVGRGRDGCSGCHRDLHPRQPRGGCPGSWWGHRGHPARGFGCHHPTCAWMVVPLATSWTQVAQSQMAQSHMSLFSVSLSHMFQSQVSLFPVSPSQVTQVVPVPYVPLPGVPVPWGLSCPCPIYPIPICPSPR